MDLALVPLLNIVSSLAPNPQNRRPEAIQGTLYRVKLWVLNTLLHQAKTKTKLNSSTDINGGLSCAHSCFL